jgi:hypothetical protein
VLRREVGENCRMSSFMIVLFAKYNQNDQVKEDEMKTWVG